MKACFASPAARFTLAGVTLLLLQTSCLAHAGDMEGSDESSWGLGLIGMAKNKPYRDFDNKAELLPMVTYENRWVRVFGPGVDFKLGKTGQFSYALTASYADDGYDSSDSSFLSGMSDRKSSAWLGAKVNWDAGLAKLSASWSGDASSNSQGQKLRLGIERRFSAGDWSWKPYAAATWLDKKYVDYYYGVTAAEATARRHAYQGSATVNGELGIGLDYRLAPGQTVFFDVNATVYGSGIKDSPLVDQSVTPGIRAGYLYRF